MGEELTDEAWRPSARAESTALAATLAAALAADTPEARDYLNRQNRLTELQIGQLQQAERLEFAHLRFRHFSDIGKLGLQLSGRAGDFSGRRGARYHGVERGPEPRHGGGGFFGAAGPG